MCKGEEVEEFSGRGGISPVSSEDSDRSDRLGAGELPAPNQDLHWPMSVALSTMLVEMGG